MNSRTSVIVIGGGRMGRAILEAGLEDPGIEVAGVAVRRAPAEPLPGAPSCFTDLEAALAAVPEAVVLDFAAATDAGVRIRAAAAAGHSIVVGTTGLGEDAEAAVGAAAEQVAVVVAPNTSPGVALLVRALQAVAPASTLGWDAGILDRHHRAKRDAPSGTARLLERELRALGASGVGVVSLRQGGVIGEHSVHWSGDDEELVLVHRAFSRRVFARGALLAARFAARTPAGRYEMDDVLA